MTIVLRGWEGILSAFTSGRHRGWVLSRTEVHVKRLKSKLLVNGELSWNWEGKKFDSARKLRIWSQNSSI